MALNLDFVRQDYHSLGPCMRNTMKVLAQGKHVSPYVFGDEAGELTCFEIKKGDPIISWQLPQVEKAISCVTLSRYKPGKKQNIFCGSGHIVRGTTQKGKQFFKMETYNTDAIKNLLVDGQKLHTGSDYLLNAYDVVPQEISDSGLFLCEDKINDVSLENIFTDQGSNPILACQDKSIRLLDAMKLYYQIPFDAPILALGKMSTYVKSGVTPVGYGTKGGTFGVFDFQKDLPKRIWDIGLDEGMSPGIQVMQIKDFSRSDMVDYIIGREDGTVELLSAPTIHAIPEQRLQVNLNESISSLDSGIISNPNSPEILVSSYSGQVMGLVDRKTVKHSDQDKLKKIKELQNEIYRLEEKVRFMTEDSAGVTALETNIYKSSGAIKQLPMEAAFEVVLESQQPMEYVTLQSPITMDVLDSSEANSAINYQIRSELYKFQVILHCVGFHTNKIKLKLRTSEGQSGSLLITLIPHGPCKVVKSISLDLKPLSLHTRVLDNYPDPQTQKMSEIRVMGNFSKLDFHTWVAAALPQVPPQYEDGDTILVFKSTFIGSLLYISYDKGNASVMSNSLSTLTIIKDVLLKQASLRKMQIDFASSIEPDTVFDILELLKPKLDYYDQLAKNFKMIDALKEMQMSDEMDLKEFMKDSSSGYKRILANAEEIKKEYNEQPRKLNFIWSIITDLQVNAQFRYVDRAKILGNSNFEKQLQVLKGILMNYKFEKIVGFFKTS